MAETYESLKTKMSDWLGVDTTRLPDAVRGDCINLIQRRVLRQHDLRFGEISSTLAISANDRDYALPTGWRSPLSLWYISPTTAARVALTWRQKDEFDAEHSDPTAGGSPVHYTVWGSLLYVGPTPDISFTLNLNYYRFLPDLVDGSPNNTNAFVEQAWDVLFFGALEEASKYTLEDPRAAIWGGRYYELLSNLVGEHQRSRSAGRVPQSREPG